MRIKPIDTLFFLRPFTFLLLVALIGTISCGAQNHYPISLKNNVILTSLKDPLHP
jgi:hypothetical protein